MNENPHICFQTHVMKNILNWKSVVVWREFTELTKDSERKEGIQKLLARKIEGISRETEKLSLEWSVASDEHSDEINQIIFCIRLDEKTGRFEKSEYHGVSG